MYLVEYHSAIKEKGILPFGKTWMNPEDIVLSEISQTEKDKYCMISFTCGIFKKKKKQKQLNPKKQRIDWCLPGTGGLGKQVMVGQSV